MGLAAMYLSVRVISDKSNEVSAQRSPSMVKGVESLQSDADASGAYRAGVRGFKSHPLHFCCSFLACLAVKQNKLQLVLCRCFAPVCFN